MRFYKTSKPRDSLTNIVHLQIIKSFYNKNNHDSFEGQWVGLLRSTENANSNLQTFKNKFRKVSME